MHGPMRAAFAGIFRIRKFIRRMGLIEEMPASLPEAQPLRIIECGFWIDE